MLKALSSGLAGATALNVIHQTARYTLPHAPRMDVIGARAISRPMRAMGMRPPHWNRLFWYTMAGDIVSNSLYYSLVGIGSKRTIWKRGLGLGLLAGLGAALLPPVLGLGQSPHRKTPFTQILTVLWYTFGGLAAAGTMQALSEEEKRQRWIR